MAPDLNFSEHVHSTYRSKLLRPSLVYSHMVCYSWIQLDLGLQINWNLSYLNYIVISLKISFKLSYTNLIQLICRSRSKLDNIAHCTERKRDLTLRTSTTIYASPSSDPNKQKLQGKGWSPSQKFSRCGTSVQCELQAVRLTLGV